MLRLESECEASPFFPDAAGAVSVCVVGRSMLSRLPSSNGTKVAV